MGEAARRRAAGAAQANQRPPLIATVARVSKALRKLAEAASSNLGSDCYLHASLGKLLLADQGFDFQVRVGFAAWRVGPGDGDVVSHTQKEPGYLPVGAMGFAYHAWLESRDWLVDLTTYQLRRKAQDLDTADGGHTTVEWCPDYLLLRPSAVKPYQIVAQAPGAGVAYYESDRALTEGMAATSERDEETEALARIVFSNPDLQVVGPNTFPGQA